MTGVERQTAARRRSKNAVAFSLLTEVLEAFLPSTSAKSYTFPAT